MGGFVVFRVLGINRGILDELLECLPLAHEFDQFGVCRSALVDAVLIFSEQFFQSAASFLSQHLVYLSLGKAVSVSTLNLKRTTRTWLRK